ncbi:MAG: hypothetical protein P8Z41_11725 [Anaerolineales bacterium]
MEKRKVINLLIGMSAILIVLIVLVEFNQATVSEEDWGSSDMPVGDEMGGGSVDGLAPTPSPKPEPASTQDPGADNNSGGTQQETIIRERVVREVHFPYENLSDGVQGAITDIFEDLATATKGKFQEALSDFQSDIPEYEQKFRGAMFSAWKVTAGIAAILMPLVLILVVVSSLKEGTTSVTGYAAARESLLNWVICIAAAASSYFLLSKAVDLSKALELAITDGMTKAVGETIDWGWHLLGNLLTIEVSGLLFGVLMAIFAILLSVALASSIILSWFAVKIIVLLSVAIAPIILIIGIMSPFRWLQGLWLKITTVALLLFPINRLLLGIGALISAKFATSPGIDIPEILIAYLIATGILSILIGVNTIIGKLIFGAAIEVAGKMKDMVMGALNIATIALGASPVGGAITSAIGGAASGMTSAAGVAGSSAAVMAQQNLSNSIGNAIAKTGLPGASGLAAGMRVRNALQAQNQLSQLTNDIGQGLSNPAQLQGPLDLGLSRQRSTDGIMEDYGTDNMLHAVGMKDNELSNRVNAGNDLADATLSAMKDTGRISTLMSEMGYTGNLQSASDNYHRWVSESYALRNHAKFTGPSSFAPADPSRLSARDFNAATEIVREIDPKDIGPYDASLMSGLAHSIHQRRRQTGQSHEDIVKDATKSSGVEQLKSWMKAL